MTKNPFASLSILLCLAQHNAMAADWSSLSMNWRYGSNTLNSFKTLDNHKTILGVTFANGDEWGTNLLCADLESSDTGNPQQPGSTKKNQEIYVFYRHTLNIGKVIAEDLSSDMIRGYGMTAGFDWNPQRNAGHRSRNELLVLGPTIMFDIPGYLNVSYLLTNEKKTLPGSSYTYKLHPMLDVAWSTPLSERWNFNGFATLTAPKGIDETGIQTRTETYTSLRLMYDISNQFNASKNSFRLGVEYQFWISSILERTPLIRAEISL